MVNSISSSSILFYSYSTKSYQQLPRGAFGLSVLSLPRDAVEDLADHLHLNVHIFYFHQIKIYDWLTSACLNISSFWRNENECFQEDKILKMCIHFWRLETDVHRHSSWNIENTFSSSAHTETHVKTSSLLILTFSPPLSFRLHRSRGGLVSCSGSAGGQNCWQWSFWQVGPTVHIYWWFGNY